MCLVFKIALLHSNYLFNNMLFVIKIFFWNVEVFEFTLLHDSDFKTVFFFFLPSNPYYTIFLSYPIPLIFDDFRKKFWYVFFFYIVPYGRFFQRNLVNINIFSICASH
jgi:hypothetical protein